MTGAIGRVWAAGANDWGQLGDGTTDGHLAFAFLELFPDDPLLTAVCGGHGHTLALSADATVWAWGRNHKGQLGDATTDNRTTPVRVLEPAVFQGDDVIEYRALENVIAVAAGDRHSLALRADGTVCAWGGNDWGQLGDGTATPREAADSVGGLGGDMIAVAAGFGHSIALRADGTVWTWGRNNAGQLGDGTTTDSLVPLKVKGLTRVSAIAAGAAWTLALVADGTVLAWGHNHKGQLGDGTTTNSPVPLKVKGPGGAGSLANVVALAAGVRHSLALRGDGTVWVWGGNDKGQLGDDTTHMRKTPVQAKDPKGTSHLTGIVAIAAGPMHSLALQGSARAFAWGWNNAGRLGDGTTTDRHLPVAISDKLSRGVIGIGAGAMHSLLLSVWCGIYTWGDNKQGQLGSKTGGSSAVVTAPLGGAGVDAQHQSAPAAGAEHSLALQTGVMAKGSTDLTAAQAWGANDRGQLGNHTTKPHFKPDWVLGPSGKKLTSVKAVAAGLRHSLALASDGTVWGWGANDRGQLGIGTSSNSAKPVKVKGPGGDGLLGNIAAVAARGDHSLALRADGTVWGWGANDHGQLGDGMSDDRDLPVQVANASFIKAIAAGGQHSLALRADGTLWAWGAGERGQLGRDSLLGADTPVAVDSTISGGLKKALAAGDGHSLALRADGSAWAWGANDRGQVGDDTTEDRLIPVRVGDGKGAANQLLAKVTAIAAGGQHSLALDTGSAGVKSGGLVRSWGANEAGQLGDKTNEDRLTAVVAWPPNGAALRGVVWIAGGGAHSLAIAGPVPPWDLA